LLIVTKLSGFFEIIQLLVLKIRKVKLAYLWILDFLIPNFQKYRIQFNLSLNWSYIIILLYKNLMKFEKWKRKIILHLSLYEIVKKSFDILRFNFYVSYHNSVQKLD
jgi:hypothetical protein